MYRWDGSGRLTASQTIHLTQQMFRWQSPGSATWAAMREYSAYPMSSIDWWDAENFVCVSKWAVQWSEVRRDCGGEGRVGPLLARSGGDKHYLKWHDLRSIQNIVPEHSLNRAMLDYYFSRGKEKKSQK